MTTGRGAAAGRVKHHQRDRNSRDSPIVLATGLGLGIRRRVWPRGASRYEAARFGETDRLPAIGSPLTEDADAHFLAELSQHRILAQLAVAPVRPCGDERAAGAQGLSESVPQPLDPLRLRWTTRPVLARVGHPHRTDRRSVNAVLNAYRSPDLSFMSDWTDGRRILTPIWPTTASVGALSSRCLGL